MEFPTQLTANTDTRAGRMLAEGDVRVTVTDLESNEHITVRFKAFRDNRPQENGERPIPDVDRNWVRSPLSEATHVFMEVPSASGDYPDKIGSFYPRTGWFFNDRNADPERVDAAAYAAAWLNDGHGDEFLPDDDMYRYQEESYCGKCGRTLTDPESIDRGIGPECLRQATSSQHQVKQQRVHNEPDADDDLTLPRKSRRTHTTNTPDVVQPGLTELADLPNKRSRDRVEGILAIVADMSDKEIDAIRRELNMWQSQGRTSLFER